MDYIENIIICTACTSPEQVLLWRNTIDEPSTVKEDIPLETKRIVVEDIYCPQVLHAGFPEAFLGHFDNQCVELDRPPLA